MRPMNEPLHVAVRHAYTGLTQAHTSLSIVLVTLLGGCAHPRDRARLVYSPASWLLFSALPCVFASRLTLFSLRGALPCLAAGAAVLLLP